MKKKRGFLLIWFVLFILMIGLVNASFDFYNHKLETDYVGGEKIKGFINVSFDDEPVNSIIRSNFNDEDEGMRIIDLLKGNGFVEGEDFECNYEGCRDKFETKSEINSFILNDTEDIFIGVRLNGNNVQLDDVSFDINTDSLPSCSPGFNIYLLGNESLNVQSNSYNDVSCGQKIRGCFDDKLDDYDMAIVGKNPYCQKIELPVSPAFRIGAKVKNSTTGGKLTMRLFDDDWYSLGDCDLPKHQNEIQELSCIVEVPNSKMSSYYVCIESDYSQNQFEIESEVNGDVCGNSGTDFYDYERDYNIFAQPLQFNNENITVDEDIVEKSTDYNIIEIFNDYINKEYSRNCIDGCVIPIKIVSNTPQNFELSKINVRYNSNAAILTNNKIYEVDESRAELSSDPLKINIEYANLFLPLSTTKDELQLYLDGSPILNNKLDVVIKEGFVFEIAPKFIQFAQETTFLILSSKEIKKARWNFGDGTISDFDNNIAKHIYLKEGKFNLSVEATSLEGSVALREFEIIVGNVSTSFRKILNESEYKISMFSNSLNSFPPWIKSEIMKKENITYYQGILNKMKISIDTANNSEIEKYAYELYNLKIPEFINYTSTGRLPIDVGFNNIDSKYLIDYSESECTDTYSNCNNYDFVDKDKVNDYLISWNYLNFESWADFQTISIIQNSDIEPIYTYFSIDVSKISDYYGDSYIIIPYPYESIAFKEDYNIKEVSGAVIIPFDSDIIIDFLVEGEVTPVELGVYATPDLEFIINDLKIEPSCEDFPESSGCKKNKRYWWIVFVVLAFIAAYLVLQEWYKRRYESHLFANRDDLYNVINYIHNSRVSGTKDEKIKKDLAGMKWKSEQMIYAFKKIDGKRTGMWEIPIFKFIENRKVKEEIEKRNQQNSVNGGQRKVF